MVRINIRFLNEEGESLWVTDEVRKWRRRLPRLSKRFRRKFELDRYPWRKIPYREGNRGPYSPLWLRHVITHPWGAPQYYFACPFCFRRTRRLVRLDSYDYWACRKCHRTKYASQVLRPRMGMFDLDRIYDKVAQAYQERRDRPGPRSKRERQIERQLERMDGLTTWLPKWVVKELARAKAHRESDT